MDTKNKWLISELSENSSDVNSNDDDDAVSDSDSEYIPSEQDEDEDDDGGPISAPQRKRKNWHPPTSRNGTLTNCSNNNIRPRKLLACKFCPERTESGYFLKLHMKKTHPAPRLIIKKMALKEKPDNGLFLVKSEKGAKDSHSGSVGAWHLCLRCGRAFLDLNRAGRHKNYCEVVPKSDNNKNSKLKGSRATLTRIPDRYTSLDLILTPNEHLSESKIINSDGDDEGQCDFEEDKVTDVILPSINAKAPNSTTMVSSQIESQTGMTRKQKLMRRLSHGARPPKLNGKKRKGVEEYALEYNADFTTKSIEQDGEFIQYLVCRYCPSQIIGARSDRIKEHLTSRRHKFNKRRSNGNSSPPAVTEGEKLKLRKCKDSFKIGSKTNRKTIVEYAREFSSDLTTKTIKNDEILICRYCESSIRPRSDRIKEHLMSKRHGRNKLKSPEFVQNNLPTTTMVPAADTAAEIKLPYAHPIKSEIPDSTDTTFYQLTDIPIIKYSMICKSEEDDEKILAFVPRVI